MRVGESEWSGPCLVRLNPHRGDATAGTVLWRNGKWSVPRLGSDTREWPWEVDLQHNHGRRVSRIKQQAVALYWLHCCADCQPVNAKLAADTTYTTKVNPISLISYGTRYFRITVITKFSLPAATCMRMRTSRIPTRFPQLHVRERGF
jgi:hypothetical protein